MADLSSIIELLQKKHDELQADTAKSRDDLNKWQAEKVSGTNDPENPKFAEALQHAKTTTDMSESAGQAVGSIGRAGKGAANAIVKKMSAAEEMAAAPASSFGKVAVVQEAKPVGKVIMSDGKPTLTSYVKKVEELPVTKTTAEEIVLQRIKDKTAK